MSIKMLLAMDRDQILAFLHMHREMVKFFESDEDRTKQLNREIKIAGIVLEMDDDKKNQIRQAILQMETAWAQQREANRNAVASTHHYNDLLQFFGME